MLSSGREQKGITVLDKIEEYLLQRKLIIEKYGQTENNST